MRFVTLALSAMIGSSCLAQAQDWVWWEAEKPAATNFPPAQRGDAKEQEVLSGGLWLVLGGDHGAGKFLEYDVEVPSTGEYDFFVRKFWKHGPFRYRFDDQPWQEVGRDPTLLDSAEIRTHWGANWVPAGTAKLEKGTRRLRIEVMQESGAAAFDAFLLTQAPFTPRGKIKPDEKFPLPPEGWLNFEPGIDSFGESLLDLRSLNEQVAGENGFIKVDGEDFIHEKTGKTVKFWAVNAGPAVIDMPRRYVDSLARFLAKKGVNMVRMHGPLYIQSGPKAGQIDEKHLDNVFYFIAAMKREGIYTHLSIHFQHWLRINELEQFPGYTAETMPFAIHFFNDEYQKIYQSWWDALLSRKNPHTGNKLVDEPAMAGLELLNEDSFFFWTFTYERIPQSQMEILEKLFAQWAKKRHGSLENAMQAWGGKREEDEADQDRLYLVGPWHLFSIRDARAQDTARFLAEVQRAFFDNHRDYVRKLGFKGAVCASNWITASPEYLEPIDTWTNLGTDFIDHHGYFDRPAKKNVEAFAFQPGDQYADRSIIRMDPEEVGKDRAASLPFLDAVHNGQPSMVSEYAWMNPNRFRTEGPIFASALSSLNGMDAMVLFALDSVPQWRGSETENYFPIQAPGDIGQSPAASIIFRKGYIREADAVVRVNVNVDDMFSLKGSPSRTASLGDFIRAAEAPRGQAQQESRRRIDTACMAVGKLAIDYSEKPASFQVEDLSGFVDSARKAITSQNGETRWEYGRGLFLLTSPMAHGAVGFLKSSGSVQLPQASISSDMEFGSIVLVPLDDKPLAESGKILLQVMSEQQNTGWQTEGPADGMKTIRSVGHMPIIYKPLSGEVKLDRADGASLKVTALDWNGYPTKQLAPGATIRIEPNCPYYLIEKQ